MNLIELSRLLLDEKLAEEYLREKGILKTFTQCEKCGSEKIGRIRRGRYKCYGCKSEWGIRKGSILHAQSISCSKFIGLIKMFEMNTSAESAAFEVDVNRKTAFKFFEMFREVILGDENHDSISDDEMLKDESQIFTISIVNDKVHITDYKSGRNNKDLFTIKRTRIPNKGASYYFHHKKVSARQIKCRIKNFPIPQHHFWRYANEKLLKYRGTKSASLFMFLKEIEFRYNYSGKFYQEFVKKIAN